MTRACSALLALNLVYCVLATLAGVDPWSMFSHVEPLAYTLQDRSGRAVDVHDYVTRGHYILNPRQLARVAAFICRKEPQRAPFFLTESDRAVRVEVHAPDCLVTLSH